MTDKKEILWIPYPQAAEEDIKGGKLVSVRRILWSLLEAFKNGTDHVAFLTQGGLDAEEFLECLDTGLPHPLLDAWQACKSAVNRPPPTSREKAIRRYAVLACFALVQTGMTDLKARQQVAKQIKAAKVLASEPTAEALRNWRRACSPLTSQDNVFIETAKKKAGADHKKLVCFFVEWMEIARMPAPLLKALPV